MESTAIMSDNTTSTSYVDDLVEAGRQAAVSLFHPQHRGAIVIGGGRVFAWSWETPAQPHLEALDRCLREEFGEWYGGIRDGLGAWIIEHEVDADEVSDFIWHVFVRSM